MAETTWTYDIQDFSPLVKYAADASTNPPILPNITPAWSQLCPVGNTTTNEHNNCDTSSIHTTTFLGASVTLDFFGQGIQLFGAVSSGMTYKIILDNGSPQVGNVTGSLLANITNLTNGEHTITLSATSASGTLSYSGATIEVGTGLTGATVNRQTIQDVDPQIDYVGAWFNQSFDPYDISHTDGNTTWSELFGAIAGVLNPGSFSFAASGNAVFVHAPTWSFFPTDYRVLMDGDQQISNYGNASLQTTSLGQYTTDAVTYFNANLSGAHTFVLDNDNGAGYIALDYVEIITVSGGTPIAKSSGGGSSGGSSSGGTNSSGGGSDSAGTNSSTQDHHTLATNPGIIVLEVLAGLTLILACTFWHLRRKGRRMAQERAVAGDKIAPFTGLPTTAPLAAPITTTPRPNADNSLRKGPPAIMDRFVPIPVQGKQRTGLSNTTPGEGTAGEGSGTPGEELTDSSLAPLRYQSDPPPPEAAEVATTPEIRAIRRELGQLMQVVFGRSRPVSGEAPPEYAQA